MKARNKAMLLAVCAIALISTSIFGTITYLTDNDSATNTFTVGNVGLELDEADVKPDGTLDTTERVKENEYYLIPGHTYIKDPTVTVTAKSEDAYVRMIVKVERIDQLKAALPKEDYPEYYNDNLLLLQMLCVDMDGSSTWDGTTWVYKGYTQSDDGETGTYEFRYIGNAKDTEGKPLNNEIVVKSESETKLPALFQCITGPGKVDNTHLKYLDDVKIVVNAHAIQADGFDTAEQAWDVFD